MRDDMRNSDNIMEVCGDLVLVSNFFHKSDKLGCN